MNYTAKFVSGNIDWNSIEPMVLLHNLDGKKAKFLTIAKLAYNNDGLLYKFECQEDKINCTMTGYNEPIYNEETVEFFLATTNDKKRYLELEWNGIGGVFCANINNDLNGSTTIDFIDHNIISSKWNKTADGWSVEGAVPKSLFEGKMGDSWIFNAYRIKRNPDNSMYQMAFSPTLEPAFHRPNYFVKLIFSKED